MKILSHYIITIIMTRISVWEFNADSLHFIFIIIYKHCFFITPFHLMKSSACYGSLNENEKKRRKKTRTIEQAGGLYSFRLVAGGGGGG